MGQDEVERWASLSESAGWFVRTFVMPQHQQRMLTLLEYRTQNKLREFTSRLPDLSAALRPECQQQVHGQAAAQVLGALAAVGFSDDATAISERTLDSRTSVNVGAWVTEWHNTGIAYLLVPPNRIGALLQGEAADDTVLVREQPTGRV